MSSLPCMPDHAHTEEQRRMDETCCEDCTFDDSGRTAIRIATWSQVAPTLQAYVDAYHKQPDNARTEIRIVSIPSIPDLDSETLLDLRLRTGLYDGFVAPTVLTGDLFETGALLELQVADTTHWYDILPYYRDILSEFSGIRHLPLFSGNQIVMLYRQDLFDRYNMTVPRTWKEYSEVAAFFHNQPLGPNGEDIVGSCIGRASESHCRNLTDVTKESCRSLSSTWLGMILSTITQSHGTSTGWILDPTFLQTTLTESLEQTLIYMEQQLFYGAPDELERDSTLNLDLLLNGLCAMTFSVDNPVSVIQDPAIGVTQVPGSNEVLNRTSQSLIPCSPASCPYGLEYDGIGRVNKAPFGAMDAALGSVSAVVSKESQAIVAEFLAFVSQSFLSNYTAEQPFRFSELSKDQRVYSSVLESLTSHKNLVAPLRTPRATAMIEALDDQVYEYLTAGNYTASGRRQVRERVELSMERIIKAHDEAFGAVPFRIFYQKSLGTYEPPLPSDLYIGIPLRSFGYACAAVSMALSIGCAVWVWKSRANRVVRASQPIFLLMVCAGTFIMASSIFPFGIEDDIASEHGVDIACMAAIWLYCIGFVVTFAALFSKTWRINKIYWHAQHFKRIKVKAKDVILPFVALLSFNVIVLSVWTATSPLQWMRSNVNAEFQDPLGLIEPETYGDCVSDTYAIYISILFGCNIFVSGIAIVQAYKCRKLSTEFSESQWILLALLAIIQVWIIGFPILALVFGNPKAQYFVKSGIVLVTTSTTLLLLFLPKMKYMWDSKKAQARKEAQKEARRLALATTESMASRSGLHSGTESVQSGDAGASGDANHRHEGIRIVQPKEASEAVKEMQQSVEEAEKRNKKLRERLERLKLEEKFSTLAQDEATKMTNG